MTASARGGFAAHFAEAVGAEVVVEVCVVVERTGRPR
jgi:hypothetical protein